MTSVSNSRHVEPGSSRRITVMRYPIREYQSDHRRWLLGRSDQRVTDVDTGPLTMVFPYQSPSVARPSFSAHGLRRCSPRVSFRVSLRWQSPQTEANRRKRTKQSASAKLLIPCNLV